MNRRIILLITLSWLGILFAPAQSKGVVAVMVSADAESSKYSQIIKSDFESGLSDYGFNPVEMGQDFLDAVQAYNTFLQEGAVSEFAFDDDELEERANYLFHIRIRHLGKNSYCIEVTKTKYGQTSAESKKVYPDFSLQDEELNLEKDTQRRCRMAVEFLLQRLGYTSKGNGESSISNSSSKADDLKKNIKDDKKKIDSRALVASMFVPGAGQFYKHNWGKGSTFLVSEVILVGGGTACYFMKQKHERILEEGYYVHDSDWIDNEQQAISAFRVSMIACYGLAAAVHVGNMIHAWYAQDKKPNRPVSFNIAPAIIPTNEFISPSLAMGAGLQINF